VFDSGAVTPDAGGASQCLWYAMPFTAGESLRDRVKRERQLPVDEAVRIAEDFDPFRADPRFRDLVHRVGLPAGS
jgi:eukaryotic-like serine/threonine-protein kinase